MSDLRSFSWSRVRTGLLLAVTGMFLLQAGTAFAVEDFSGTFAGPVSLQESCPAVGGGGGATAADLTVTFSLNGTSLSGQGTFQDNKGNTGTFTITGTADTSGAFSGQLDVFPVDDVESAGFVDGSLSGDQIELFFQATDVISPGCTTNGSGTLTRVGGEENVINPEVTPSSVLTAPVLLTVQVQSITSGLTARISDVMRGIGTGQRVTANGTLYKGISGMSAGEGGVSYGAWASYSYSDFNNDFVPTALDGYRHGVLFGADLAPRENMVLGIAVGYEYANIDTDFNSGNQETDGFTVAPYFGLLLSDNWNVSASVGYSGLGTDQYRTDPLAGRITSSPDSDRWFGTLNLNGYTTWENWIFTGRIGMLHARNIQKSFVESDGTAVGRSSAQLGQWNIGGEAAYSLGNFEPFARASYERDYALTRVTLSGGGPQPSNDNDNVLLGLGLRYFSDNGLSGNIEWYKRLGRENFDEDTFSATVRWEF